MKITNAQRRILENLSSEGSFLHFMPGINPYFFYCEYMKTRKPNILSVHALRRLKLIEWYYPHGCYYKKARITQLGREFLQKESHVKSQ